MKRNRKSGISGILILFLLLQGGCAHNRAKTGNDDEVKLPFKSPPPLLTLDRLKIEDAKTQTEETPQQPEPDKTAGTAQPSAPAASPQPLSVTKKQHPVAAARPDLRQFANDFVIRHPKTGNAEDGSDLTFNFDDADLYEVIRTMAELLKINYMVDPGIRGKVTIQTSGMLREKDLFTVFYQILEANGLTAVKEGSLYRIVPIKDASRQSIRAGMGRNTADLPPEEQVIMQIIPLNHISAEEMTKLLTPFVSTDGTIISHGDSNTLLVVDKRANVLKALKLVSAFDVDIFQNVSHRFYEVKSVEAEEMVKTLTDVLSAYGKTEKTGLKLIAINRLNGFIAISPDPAVFSKISSLIRSLDVASESAEPRIYVYSVKNGEAEELGTLLNTVFTGTSTNEANKDAAAVAKADEAKNPFTPPNPFEKTEKKAAVSEKSGSSVRKASENQGSGTLRGEVKITPDTTRNALIIEAAPSDYRIIQGILGRLDVLPRQVLIEVVIAEITLTDDNSLGVEWSYKKGSGSITSSLLNAAAGSKSGLGFTIGETDRWSAQFSALVTDTRANILSAPVILASDNKEANINVSTKIPVASAEYIYDSSNSGVTQTNIQYRDTGIILSVTPHINERGLVNLEISQEVSEAGEGVDVGGKNYQSFRERKVETVVTVGHGQTIVMGGLMRSKKSDSNSGVPFLSKIPGIGFLFGKDSKNYEKTELILLITPRVIVNLEDIDGITEEFKYKVSRISQKAG